jgi:repressor LexA
MHPVQEALLRVSRSQNLAKLSLRGMASAIGMPGQSPQKIKHHLLQLQKKGFLTIDRARATMERTPLVATRISGLVERESGLLFSIPLVGVANCGPGELFAEQNFQGFLRVSSKLVGRSRPTGLYALKADGSSMNRAAINGRTIGDGDYVIVDSRKTSARDGDVVVAVLENRATIKRFIDDRDNGQVVLRADSSFDYEPIHLHPDDEVRISGTVIAVIKRPAQE